MLSVSPSMSSVLSPSVTALTTAPATGSAPQLQKQPIVSKKAEPMQYGSNKCPECHVQFNSRTEVVAHFQEVKPALNTVRVCVRVYVYLCVCTCVCALI